MCSKQEGDKNFYTVVVFDGSDHHRFLHDGWNICERFFPRLFRSGCVRYIKCFFKADTHHFDTSHKHVEFRPFYIRGKCSYASDGLRHYLRL